MTNRIENRAGRSRGPALAFFACGLAACTSPPTTTMTTIEHLNPPGLHRSPAFSQAIRVSGAHRTVYVGGQNAVTADGRVVGTGDIEAQAAQVGRNLAVLLDAAGATVDDVVRWGVHIVAGHAPAAAMQAFQRELGRAAQPATVTVVFVAALAHPDFLIEVDAIAVLPESP